MEILETNRRTLQTWSAIVFLLTIFVRIIPGTLIYGSEDVTAWSYASTLWEYGQDPYTQNYVFNWPPFWLTIVHGLIHAGQITGIPSHLMIKMHPITADGIIALIIFRIFITISNGDLKKSLTGTCFYSLNPISIVISSIHGNFISVPLSLLLVAVYFQAFSRKPWNLTWASLSLGCGIMSKIWPIAALPLFLQKTRSIKQKLMFLPLAAAPVLAALLPLYLKNKDMVMERFIKYQSQPGWWGLTGFGQIWDVRIIKGFCGWYATHGNMILLATFIGLLFLTRFLDMFRALLLVFLAVLFLMNGYGPQYLMLILPFAVILQSKWLIPFTLFVSALFCFEYGLIPLPDHCSIPILCNGMQVPSMSMEQLLRINRMVNIFRLPLWLFIGIWFVNELYSSRTSQPLKMPSKHE